MTMKRMIVPALAVLFCAFCVMMVRTTSVAVKERAANVVGLKGTVEVKYKDAESWVPAAERMELKEGDVIRTQSGSTAILRMENGTMMKLAPLTNMKVERLNQTRGGDNTSLDISAGKTWSRVKKLSDESDFSIKTPTAVAGVRGTFFSSEVENTADSTFDVFEGAVAVSSASDSGASVMVGANQRTTVAPNESPSAPSEIPQNERDAGAAGFSSEEYAAASYDLQISVSPQVVEPGGIATLQLQVFENGKSFQSEVKVYLTLSGSATFVSSGSNEIEATTSNQGSLTLEITSTEKETVTVSARMSIKVRK